MRHLSPFYKYVRIVNCNHPVYALEHAALPIGRGNLSSSAGTPYIQHIPLTAQGGDDYTDWIPCRELPTGDNFHGMNRNLDRARLAGGYLKYDKPGFDNLTEATALVSREGGDADRVFLATDAYETFKLNLNPTPPYASITIFTAYGAVEISEDPTLEAGTGYVLTMDSWELLSSPFNGHTALVCCSPWKNAALRFAAVEAKIVPKCDCGAASVGAALHSHWCSVK